MINRRQFIGALGTIGSSLPLLAANEKNCIKSQTESQINNLHFSGGRPQPI